MGWARRINKWHDEVGPLHLTTATNKPARGAKVYAMGMDVVRYAGAAVCAKCQKIYDKRVERHRG